MATYINQAEGIEQDLDYESGYRIKDNQTVVGEHLNSDIIEFFQRLMAQGGIPFNGQKDNRVNGFQFIEALYAAVNAHVVIGAITPIMNNRVRKRISIGSWGIYVQGEPNILSKSVAHGLSATEWKTINSIDVILRNDSYTGIYPINTPPGAGDFTIQGGVANIGDTNIGLIVKDEGYFCSIDFSSTVMNRGYITIEYTPD